MPEPIDPSRLGLDEIVRSTPCPDPELLAKAEIDLRGAMAAVRDALGQFDEAEHEAWTLYARTVDRAIVHLEAELNVSAAQLGVLQANTADDLTETMRRARTSWSAMNDEVRLQAHLAEMDARERLEHAGTTIQSAIETLATQAGHELDVVRTEAAKAVHALRNALTGMRDETPDPT